MHPNAALLRRLFAAYAAGDLDAVGAALTSDVVWETPGRSALAGRRVGVEAVVDQLGRAAALSDGTYRAEVRDVLASDAHAVVLYTGTATRAGRTAALDVVVYTVADGRITHVRAIPADAAAFDAFWT